MFTGLVEALRLSARFPQTHTPSSWSPLSYAALCDHSDKTRVSGVPLALWSSRKASLRPLFEHRENGGFLTRGGPLQGEFRKSTQRLTRIYHAERGLFWEKTAFSMFQTIPRICFSNRKNAGFLLRNKWVPGNNRKKCWRLSRLFDAEATISGQN